MKISPGQYVKATYDFKTDRAEELCFQTGAVILVTKVVDDNWLCGRSEGNEGNFPVNFVERLNVPELQHGQKLFIAVETFSSQENGDLTFRKGEVILGVQAVDSYWWTGEIGNRSGIFPTTFVKELPQLCPDRTDDRTQNVPHTKSTKGSPYQTGVPFTVTALVDVTPQLDGELGFSTGDVITVTEIVDDDWFSGELRGKRGLVSTVCVQLPKDFNSGKPVVNERQLYSYMSLDYSSTSSTTDSAFSSRVDKRNSSSYEIKNGTDGVTSGNSFNHEIKSKVHSSFQEVETRTNYDNSKIKGDSCSDKTNNASFPHERDKTQTHAYTPDFYVLETSDVYAELDAYIESVANDPLSEAGGYTSENTRSSDVVITPYARVLYPFVSQSSEELSVNENDIVTLIQHVDPYWIEGELDGKIGLFPASYVEIIVDCPYAYDQSTVSVTNQIVEKDSETDDTSVDNTNKEESCVNQSGNNDSIVSEEAGQREGGVACNDAALVRFNFEPLSAGDLKIREGETITLTKVYEDGWYEAVDENGNVGLVPSNYLEIIKCGPGEATDVNPQSSAIYENSMEVYGGHSAVSNEDGERNDYDGCEEVSVVKSMESNVSGLEDVEKEEESSENVEVSSEVVNVSESKMTLEEVSKPDEPKEPSEPQTSTVKASKPMPPTKPKLAPKPNVKPKPVLPSKPASSSREKTFPLIKPSMSLDSIIAGEMSKAKGLENKSMDKPDGKTTQRDQMMSRSYTTTVNSPPFFHPPHSIPTVLEEKAPLDSENKTQQPDNTSSVSRSTGNVQPRTEPQRPKPLRPKSTNVGRSSFFVNEAYVSDNCSARSGSSNLSRPRSSVKNKSSSRAPPPRPQEPVSEKPRPLPSRPAPVAPGRHIKPARQAPPRPTSSVPARKRLSLSQSTSSLPTADLMAFSPEEEAEDAANAEVILELKNRIGEVKADLKKYVKSKEDVITLMKTVNGKKDEEITESLGFYEANITGLTEELRKLKENLYQLSPREKRAAEMEEEAEKKKEEERKRKMEEKMKRKKEKDQRKEKRQRIIEEIIETEKTFLQYLQLCMDTFLSPSAEKLSAIDYDKLFGNMEEIADVSQKFLTSLENNVNGKKFEDQIVGSTFVKFSEDMKNTYAPYCRNHDEVITILEKYNGVPEIKDYFNRMIEVMRDYVNVFDLDALLIKPVQRILKYPLLLGELLRNTEDSHKDKIELVNAITCITDVAKAINEYKRRKDLVYKYKIQSDSTFGDKISKLSLHTLKKKSSRMRGRLSTTMGISLQTQDENFNREENRFRILEKTVKIFVKDIQTYLENIQESISCQENCVVNIVDFYGDKINDDVKKYKSLYKKIAGVHFTEFKSTVDRLVVSPLNRLISMFNGPINVIGKRFDKLLDYDSLFRKSKDTEKYNDALLAAKNDYEAMNAQLLDELPKLYKLSYSMFTDCISSFVQAQKKYIDSCLQQTYSELDLPFVLGAGESFIETFNVKHTQALDHVSGLSFIPRGFNPKYDTLHRQDSIRQDKKNKRLSLDSSGYKSSTFYSQTGCQSESQKVYVIQTHPSDKLYEVATNYTATDLMDLSLQQGTVVGVLKEQDPMGNKEKWFVDDGANKGFIQKSALTPFYQQVPSININSNLLDVRDTSDTTSVMSSCSQEYQDDMDSLFEENEEYKELILPEVQEFYYSEYPFTARTSNEVSLFEGQVVTVLIKHDQNDNPDWWYVDADGQHGYAPSNYLKPM